VLEKNQKSLFTSYRYCSSNQTNPTNISGSKNPEVGSGSIIDYNPNDNGDRIVNQDGTVGRPPQVGLAHELLHAENNVNGAHDITEVPKMVDPDNAALPVHIPLSREEVKVRERDSHIRQEQGAKPRMQPFYPLPAKPEPLDYKIDLRLNPIKKNHF
jgi:hypothetical protein